MPVASEDTILFGNRNELIHNEFCTRIQNALVDGVNSLPLMGGGSEENETRVNLMLSKLRKIYIRNVDMAEMYNERNSFTVARRTNHFRIRIVERFHTTIKNDRHHDDDHQGKAEGETERQGTKNDEEKGKLQDSRSNKTHDADATTHNNTTSSSGTTITSTNATIEELRQQPSTFCSSSTKSESIGTMISQLEEEIKSLRLRLQQAQSGREEKMKQCKTLEEAVEFSKQARDTLTTIKTGGAGGGSDESGAAAGGGGGALLLVSKVSNQVETMVQAQQEYNNSLKSQGNRLIQKMDDLKKQQQANENDNDDENENENDVCFDVVVQHQQLQDDDDDDDKLLSSSPLPKKIKKSSSLVLPEGEEQQSSSSSSYETQKRNVLGETQPADLFALRDLLKK